jgi:8-oxo-dGTP diphosphatase
MPKVQKKYKFAVIASDVVIFTVQDEELKVLLIKMKKIPFENKWAVPGGLVGGEEDLDQAAKRILYSETSVKDVYLEQLYTFGKVNRDPFGRVVSVAYFALAPIGGVSLKTTKDYADVKWVSVKKLPALAYDHDEIIAHALGRLKGKLEYTNIIYSLLPTEFALSDLQKMYEIILGRELDKRNFRKKIMTLQLIKKVNKKRYGGANRPAELYTFIKKTPQNVEIL